MRRMICNWTAVVTGVRAVLTIQDRIAAHQRINGSDIAHAEDEGEHHGITVANENDSQE